MYKGLNLVDKQAIEIVQKAFAIREGMRHPDLFLIKKEEPTKRKLGRLAWHQHLVGCGEVSIYEHEEVWQVVFEDDKVDPLRSHYSDFFQVWSVYVSKAEVKAEARKELEEKRPKVLEHVKKLGFKVDPSNNFFVYKQLGLHIWDHGVEIFVNDPKFDQLLTQRHDFDRFLKISQVFLEVRIKPIFEHVGHLPWCVCRHSRGSFTVEKRFDTVEEAESWIQGYTDPENYFVRFHADVSHMPHSVR